MERIKDILFGRMKEHPVGAVGIAMELTEGININTGKDAPTKVRDTQIQWFRFLPKNRSLKRHINGMMREGLSDAYILANCVRHARDSGHADTPYLRRKIGSSIRAVRCIRRKR